MRDLLLLADEPAESAAEFGALGLALGWVRHRVAGDPAAEFVLDDPTGTLEPLAELRALCAERGLRPVYAAGTTDASVVYATLWAEALNVRCACPSDCVDFFYDRLVQRRELGAHPWNIPAVAGDELDALPGDGPWVVKARGGPGRTRKCATRADVAAAVGELGADHLVEPWLPGYDIAMDAFYVHGAIRLIALGESTVDSKVAAWLAGPVLPEELVADLLADLSDLLTARGFEEGPVHARFRLRGAKPALVSLRPRPGGDGLPSLGAASGTADLMDCYRRMLTGDDLPPYSFPSRWAYQLRAGQEVPYAAARAAVPDAEFTDLGERGWSLRLRTADETIARAAKESIEALV
ncbi:hypothetical protein ACFPM7_13005 [Actinokineospora guangxiensis]|uniref:ATP-grasp domain-containing protein n=1 Tax=Actinokineospora guangxiensis TaxID=1490288 RepID=A0ABW0ENQ1_9PSEU